MLSRHFAPLVLLATHCLAAGQGIPASGGLWSQYKPTSSSSGDGAVLVSRGNEIQTTKSYRMKVNHATGAVDPAPRSAFDSTTDFIVGDGDSPVFWTRSWEDPGGVISVRDWDTGVVTGTIPASPALLGVTYLDEFGAVVSNGRKLAVAGLNGEDQSEVATQTLGSGYSITIAASSQYIAIAYEMQANYNSRIEVYDRATLAFQAGINPVGDLMSAHGDLLACLDSPSSLSIRRLPSLATLATIPISLKEQGGLIDFKMVPGGLWVFQRAANPFEKEFRYYDLANPTAPAVSNRLTPPSRTSYVGWPYQPMLAGSDFVAFAADDRSLWAWRRGESGPVAKIVPAASAREGSSASFKVKLSRAAATAVQVQVTAQSASAVLGQDFSSFSSTVSIPAGALESAAQEINILQDDVLEPNESFILSSGSTSGCVVEETAVPFVIAANGFNLEILRQYDANRTFRLGNVWGMHGPYLIGSGHAHPFANNSSRTVAMDFTTGAIVGQHSGDGLSYSLDTRNVKDGILFTYSSDDFTARQIPSLNVGSSGIPSGGKIVGPLDAQHMVVTRNYPNRVTVLKISDGSEVATHLTGINIPSVAIASGLEGLTGPVVVVQDTAFTPEDGSTTVLKILNPSTLEIVRSFSWPSFHPQMGDSSQLVAAGGRHAVFTSNFSVSVIDTVTGVCRWTIPTLSTGGYTKEAVVHGDLLLIRGLRLKQESDELLRYRFFDLTSGALLEDFSFEDLSGKPVLSFASSVIQETTTGFFVARGGQGVNIITEPVRPNVELLAEPFADNRSGELRVVPKEGFTGNHPILIDEYAEVLEDLPLASRLFGGLRQQISLTAVGTTLPLDSRRPAATPSETPRFRAISVGLPFAAAGFGKTTVNSHVGPVPEQPFFTGGPVRSLDAVSIAAGEKILALGYPLAPEPFLNPSGLVDLYDKTTGAFLRTINPPAGVANMRFGAALAITGSRIVIGAPGNNGYPSLPGRVFVYETTTGALLTELKLKTSLAFGSSIAANDSWIAVGAPGTYRVLPPTGQNERGKLVPGSVAVFDAMTFKLRFRSSTKGEMLGWSVALDGNTLFAGAPLASLKLPVPALFAGIVRSYALPAGKSKARQLPILASVRPVDRGHFGEIVAANSSLLAVFSSPATDGKKALQVHARDNMSLAAVFGVPGADVVGGALHVTDSLIFSGGFGGPLRVFDLDDQRPEVSYSLPLVQGLAFDSDFFYWGDTKPHRAALPSSSVSAFAARTFPVPSGDLNHDGRTDAIDTLLQHRLPKGLPVIIEHHAADDGALRFRFALDADLPAGSAIDFEYSPDLADWTTLLTWDPASVRWRDATGQAIGTPVTDFDPVAPAWTYDWQAPAGRTFFRTRVHIPSE